MTGWATALLVSATCAALLYTTPAFAQDDPPPDPAVVTDVVAAPAPAPVVAEPVPVPAAPVVALAPVQVQKTALDNLSSEAMNILVPAFGTLIAGLVSLLLLWMRRKFKLQVSEQQIYTWSYMARKGALRAAEWARKKTKALTEGKTLPGPDILEVGVNWALAAGEAAGLTEMGREKLEGWVEAELFDLRREEHGPGGVDPYASSTAARV